MNINPAKPPEGILFPSQPWDPADRIRPQTWERFRAKMTGDVTSDGGSFTTYIRLSGAEADRVIENIKAFGLYPNLNTGGKYGGAENAEKYWEWIREEFLEKPFRENVDAKIEEAAINSRMEEIDAERQQEKIKKEKEEAKRKEKEEAKRKEKEEQEILDADQQAIEEEVSEITEELDTVKEEEKKDTADEIKDEPEQPEENKLSNDIESIGDALSNIKGSLQTQVSDLSNINSDNTKSLSSLESLKQLFQVQTDIIKREIDLAESKRSESSIEQTTDLSDISEATSTMGDGKAEGIIELVDGPVLTVKTTEGEFKQGEKISQGGGGGFDLMGMIKGIAGKFGGKGGGGGGGGSPMKLSKGGIAISSPQSMAQGGFSPGVYNKPTRGNLLPGQAVIPMNRNVGKKMFGEKLIKTTRLQQPLLDVMSTPLKAIGLSIIAVAGNFLRLLGPLAGFFTPYISGLVKGFSAVLGVPVTIITGLLGGPAYAAMEQQDKQQNIFAKLWNDLMKTFGFNFGGEEDEKNKTQQKKGKVIRGGDADFWSLAAVASLEGATPQGEADVAQAVYNRVASGAYSVKSIKDAVLSPGQFQPVTGDGVDINLWRAVKDRQTAIAAVAAHKGKGIETATKYVDEGAANITNSQLQKSASEFVGGRTDFAVPSAANKYPGGFGYVERDGHLFGWYVGPGAIAYGKTNPGPASMPNFNISAESGTTTSDSSMGKMLGWSVVSGPNSGYDVAPNLEMHGKEAYLQHEKGFTILPIENDAYSLTKKPEQTINRWKEILSGNSGNSGGDERSYEKGGQETLVQRIFNFSKKDIRSALFGDKPSKPSMPGLPPSAKKVTQYPEGVSTGVGGGNAGASRPADRQPPKSLIGNPPPKNTPEIKKVPSETDLMMEQYEALAAAGKHSEAKELGMKIWNKNWRKTNKGLERIQTTPISATASSPSSATIQPIIMAPAPSPPPPPAPSNSVGGSSITIISADPRQVRDLLAMRRYG